MISRLYYTSLNTLKFLLISQNMLLLLLMIIEKLLRSQEMRSLELLGCSKSWLVNWFQVKRGMSSKSRLLLRCAHPLKERNEGHEAIIILRFTEFLHQALCFFLGQLLSKVGQKSEQLIANHGVVVIFIIELQDFNKVMETTLVLGVLARFVHGEDISLGEHLLSLLSLSSNLIDSLESWVQVTCTDQVPGIEGINIAITL